ncbi:hypothetical protein [Winogradskyella rapida]|uniref:Uncharacterized protein n=1 Tax=Winogradskyella rapida TaxID=549701 RepID=A0ABW3KST0_9FLAO
MKLPSNFDHLIQEAEGLKLYHKLVAQLNKDLLYANIDLEFKDDILPTSLKMLLHETILHLINSKFSDYLNLLYIVDVPEATIKSLDGSDVYVLSEQVAFIILQREWQKVWYKAQYS